MSAPIPSGSAVAEVDELFSDSSSATRVASDGPDADLGPIKESLQSQRDALADKDDERDYASQVFWMLIAFRILNSSLIRTLFQPDEYFQALEPAWDLAFGPDSGAWITWEWRHQMRSTIPPFMFGALYWSCDKLAAFLALEPSWRAELLIAAPKYFQACIAAVGDYYIWKLGELAYGYGELAHWFALIITVANPFHFFVITRTFANSLELSLNAAALYLWFTSAPEDATLTTQEVEEQEAADAEDSNLSSSWISSKLEQSTVKVKNFVAKHVRAYDLNRLRLCLVLAAVGCVLRVTNILTWIVLVSFEFLDYETKWYLLATIKGFQFQLPRIRPTLRELNHAHGVLVREAILCGASVLALSAVLDKHYYGHWTLPAFQFLYVNVVEGISIFYGTQNVAFYFTQGFPIMLGAFLPFAAIQIHHYLFRAPPIEDDFPSIIKYEFSSIALFVPLIFSFIAHKETRFIYPLIPILHTLAAGPAAEFFRPIFDKAPFARQDRKTTIRFILAAAILGINILAAIVMSLFHQRAPVDVVDFLRHEHEAHYLSQPPPATGIPIADTSMTVGFLMPCHSTPWRSHLVHRSIKAWALGCEPPLGLSAAEKAVYRDEADQFYDYPEPFLKRTLGRPKRAKTTKSSGSIWKWGATQENDGFGTHGMENEIAWNGRPGTKIWPEYLVFFAEKEQLLTKVLEGTDYVQCWRGWNTWWHDDSRRRGDMVVWCHREKPVTLEVRELGGIMAQKMTRKLGANVNRDEEKEGL